MKDIYIASDNIISPLGFSTTENFTQLIKNISGIKLHKDETLSPQPFYASKLESNHFFNENAGANFCTRFEHLLIASIHDALQNSNINPQDEDSVLIISSTKGNIDLLEKKDFTPGIKDRIALTTSAKLVSDHFKFLNKPIIISNACISGVLAILTGMRLIRSGIYKNVVIAGADIISKFVLSGFQSFQAISKEPCRPFDAARNGITLGEGAGTIILTSQKEYAQNIRIAGGSVSNDANHISGPSRTGEELSLTIRKAIDEAQLTAEDIDFIVAHGTATIYNDEMEAKAITLAGLQTVPVNSVKGYFGHTLGAAGLIETIIAVQCMKEKVILPTRGFQNLGVTKPLNISHSLQKRDLRNCLKTASGFGGCNASLVLSR